MKQFLATVAIVCCGLTATDAVLTAAEYETVRDAILSEMDVDRTLSPTLMRLTFHDCVSTTCDGCINMDNPSNAGLQPAIDALEEVYETITDASITMTRADLWALAGQVAAEYGIALASATRRQGPPPAGPPAGGPAGIPDTFVSPFTFLDGRVDCSTTPYTDEEFDFPSPHMDHTEVYEYFATNFGLDDDETTALMGAHTLGRALPENSGYSGPWIAVGNRATETFDNTYYSLMIADDVTWSLRNAQPPPDNTGDNARNQFDCDDADGNTCGFMLNSDFELFYELELDDNFRATCDVGVDCAQASTYDTAVKYAEDNALWLTDFVSVLAKMQARGYDEGALTTAVQ